MYIHWYELATTCPSRTSCCLHICMAAAVSSLNQKELTTPAPNETSGTKSYKHIILQVYKKQPWRLLLILLILLCPCSCWLIRSSCSRGSCVVRHQTVKLICLSQHNLNLCNACMVKTDLSKTRKEFKSFIWNLKNRLN